MNFLDAKEEATEILKSIGTLGALIHRFSYLFTLCDNGISGSCIVNESAKSNLINTAREIVNFTKGDDLLFGISKKRLRELLIETDNKKEEWHELAIQQYKTIKAQENKIQKAKEILNNTQ